MVTRQHRVDILPIRQYATNKSKLAKGYLGLEFDQHIVAELDSTLNSFVDGIPDHRKS